MKDEPSRDTFPLERNKADHRNSQGGAIYRAHDPASGIADQLHLDMPLRGFPLLGAMSPPKYYNFDSYALVSLFLMG